MRGSTGMSGAIEVGIIMGSRSDWDTMRHAADTLTALGHNPEYGARPLKRAVQTELETPLARALLAQTVADGDAVDAPTRALFAPRFRKNSNVFGFSLPANSSCASFTAAGDIAAKM